MAKRHLYTPAERGRIVRYMAKHGVTAAMAKYGIPESSGSMLYRWRAEGPKPKRRGAAGGTKGAVVLLRKAWAEFKAGWARGEEPRDAELCVKFALNMLTGGE